jgi:hypothetical protein
VILLLANNSVFAQSVTPASTPTAILSDSSELEAIYGIKVVSLSLSGNDYVIDLRYKVVDADKARPILDKANKPVLIHTATGDRFYVPTRPVIGSLRQTVPKKTVITADRVYFMLFANPNQKLKIGDVVSLAVGEFSKPDLEIR